MDDGFTLSLFDDEPVPDVVTIVPTPKRPAARRPPPPAATMVVDSPAFALDPTEPPALLLPLCLHCDWREGPRGHPGRVPFSPEIEDSLRLEADTHRASHPGHDALVVRIMADR